MKNIKHIFVINPAAGALDRSDEIKKKLRAVCHAADVDFDIYITSKSGDATKYIRAYLENAATDETYRFYACGGDGTLCEVANGAVGFANSEIGIYPCGTGNDFVRNFDNSEIFLDIKAQLDGEARDIDLIKINERFCVNEFNVGFDSEVVKKVDAYRRSRIVPNKLAYAFGVGAVFVRPIGESMKVFIDGVPDRRGEIVLAALLNGAYYGGGFMPSPSAVLDDGMLDLCLVNKISHIGFLRLLPSYKTGTHAEDEYGKKFVTAKKCKSLSLIFEHEKTFSIDGELFKADRVDISVCPRAAKFVLPRGITSKRFLREMQHAR